MVSVKMLESRNANESMANLFMGQLMPLYQEYWQNKARGIYNEPFNVQMQALVNLWFNGSIKIFIATDNDIVVGFCIALVYRPIAYNNTVFQIQDFYVRPNNTEAREKLIGLLMDSTLILNCNEIQSSEPLDLPNWTEMPDIITKRYKIGV